MSSVRRGYIALAAVILGILLLCLKVDLVFNFVHALVNIFAGGRSSIKVVLFLLYLAALFILAAVVRRQRKIFRVAKPLLLGVLAAAYVLNLASFFVFTATVHLKASDYAVVFNRDEISSTQLFHNHTLKGAAGIVLNLAHRGSQENVDTGLAFVGLLPDGLLYSGAILFLAACTLFVYWFMMTIPQYRVKKNVAAFILLYSIVSFSLMKNILDGGLLNHEVPIALAGLLLLLYPQRRKVWIAAGAIIGGYVALYGAAILAGLTSVANFGSVAYPFAAFLLVLALIFYWWLRPTFDRQGWLLLVLTGLFAGQIIGQNFSYISYRHQSIGSDGAIVALYGSPISQPDMRLLDQIGRLGVYDYRPTAPATVGQVLNRYNLLDNLYPVAVPWQACFPHDRPSIYQFDLLSKNAMIPPPPHPMVQVKSFQQLSSASGWFRYKVALNITPCAPRGLNLVEEFIRLGGAQTFIIVNPGI
jgi:hypothetical protein